jgi:DNA-binding response OmpR family regulator
MRVLIVEDEPNLGQQLPNTLEGAGYAVDLATDGEEGHFSARPKITMRSCSISACPRSTG